MVEQLHGGGVTKHVRRDPFPLQRGAVSLGGSGVFGDEPLNSVAAQGSASDAGKDAIFRLGMLVLKPGTEHGLGIAT